LSTADLTSSSNAVDGTKELLSVPNWEVSQQIESAQFGLAHAVESKVGGEEAVDVDGEVEDEDEEREEDGEEVPLVEVAGSKTAAYCGVKIVDVEGRAMGGGEVVLDIVVLRDQVVAVVLFVRRRISLHFDFAFPEATDCVTD
jgi:hypothetical protein